MSIFIARKLHWIDMDFCISFLPLFQNQNWKWSSQMYTNQSHFLILWPPLSIPVIFCLLLLACHSFHISKNNWKWKQTLVYVLFLPSKVSTWENVLFEKKPELTYNCCLYPSCYWHYKLNLPWRHKTNFDVTLWKVTTGTLQMVQGHRNLALDTYR